MADCPLTLTGTCCPDNEVTVITGPLVHTVEYTLPQTIEVQCLLPQNNFVEYIYSTYDFNYIYIPINDLGFVPFLYMGDDPLFVNLIDGLVVGEPLTEDFIDGGVVSAINFCQVWDGGVVIP